MTDREVVLRRIRALLLTATVAALAMLATAPTAHAAQFWTEPGTCSDGSKACINVHMKGEIVKGDAARFAKAVAKVPKGKATIYLDSNGGEFLEGFPIAKMVRRQNWNTYVDRLCTSMCADIWLAGNVRYYRRLAQIGFHTVSLRAGKGSTAGIKFRGKYWVRNVVDDALLLKFFREIGISAKTGRILLAPDLEHLTWINGWNSDPDLVASLGIKMTPWPEEPPNVVTVPASLLPKQPTVTLMDLIGLDAHGHPFPTAQRIESQRAAQSSPSVTHSDRPFEDQAVAEAPPKQVTPKSVTTSEEPGVVAGPPLATTREPGIGIAAPQRVVLYDEDPSDPKGKQYVGSVIWRTQPIKASGNQPDDIAVHADIEVPDRKFKMTMSFRRNTDTALPASHTVELTFILPQDYSGGGVANVPGILMKSNEQARSTPLAGLAVKVTGDAEARLRTLDSREQEIRSSLKSLRSEIVEVLTALQRARGRASPELLVRPEDASQSLHTAILLGAAVPELRARAEKLADELDELVAQRKTIARERDHLASDRDRLNADRILVGLSNAEPDFGRNIQLLKERSWFDVPLVYANHRRAIIGIEKGPSGEKAFANAFEKWSSENVAGQPRTTPTEPPPLPLQPPGAALPKAMAGGNGSR